MNKKYNRQIRRLFPSLDFLEYALVRAMMTLINIFPIRVSAWIAERIGDVMFLVMARRREIALDNLTLAFGNSLSGKEKRQIALGSFRHLATSIMEYFRLPKFVKGSAGNVRLSGTGNLDRAFQRGKGAILVMSHLGPWEYMVFLSYLKKYPTTVLGRPVRNPYFYRWIRSLRKMMELNYSDKTLGAREILTELKNNHLVAITIDQWAGNEGIWTYFFNVSTLTTSLPARLAQRTGAALIPAFCIRTASGQYEIRVQPPVSLEPQGADWVKRVTERLNHLLEQEIRAYPEQWTWTHKRWKIRKEEKV